MALPVLNTAKYEVTIPSTGEKVIYRPYLVKEEKILMIAMESNDNKQIIRSVKDVIQNCIDDINVNDLTLFDLEYLFMMLRGKSVGESININAKCEECDELTPYDISLDDIKAPVVLDDSAKTIMLTDKIGVNLRYPSVDDMVLMGGSAVDGLSADTSFDMMTMIIDTVFTEDEVFKMSEQSEEDQKRFIDGFNTQQLSLLLDYLDNVPAMSANLKFDCIHCKHKNEVEIKGLNSFFI